MKLVHFTSALLAALIAGASLNVSAADRPTRPDRPERTERAERPERSERAERAGDNRSEMGERHHRAEEALRHATRSGALTRDELATLKQMRDAIRAKEEAFRAQGTPLTDAQKAELQADRKALGEKTRELAQNDVRRPAKPTTGSDDSTTSTSDSTATAQ